MTNGTDSPAAGTNPDGRSPFLIWGGLFLLGLAFTLLLFGSNLLGNDEAAVGGDTAVLSQLPAPPGTARVAQLPAGGSKFVAVGDTATNFYLPDLTGEIVDLESFRGRPVIVNFWATWCAPCRLEMPALEAAYQAHQADDLVILAVNSQETHQDVTDFFAELGLTFTPLLDYDGQISRLYSVFNFPSTYFIDEAGRVTAVHRGLLSAEQIETYLAAIINKPN
ncbi:MAG: TlpA family protein disulfide reductase [Chloroflexi bacterium]|nr:TlpA family protein disulfide reductase [Chloroflexota bacterium]